MSNCKACTNEPDCRNRSTHMQNPKVECNNFEQKSFLIPVEWSVYSTIRVEAETLQDAINIANEKLDDIPTAPLDCEYIDGSYKTTCDSYEDFENAQEYRDVSSIIIRANGEIES